ncbi:EcoKI restriction-modification system protein HsdS [Streptococcus oralis]|uniref:EcoKI restriction-modification system protein HsdS n=1 Tax=Streptococcus oralis TaxID=1303 RepID=A0A428C4V5_STROR|nr:restriction endonuclease subunit S [Streptococcus oralis]RSI73018.1 EcoKI restriction-modification system protein HsdS [Streptococcus oralis]
MKKVKLGEICEIQAGGTPSRNKKEFWVQGNIPWVKIKDINSKHISKVEEHITELGLQFSSAKLFSRGTILYTIFATIGEVAILDIDAATNQAIAGLHLKSEKVLKDYLYFFLLSIKNRVKNDSRGVAQNNINLTYLKNIEVPIVENSIQQEICNNLTKINQIITQRNQQLVELSNLVKSRFNEMFGDPVFNEMRWRRCKLKDISVEKLAYGSGASAIDFSGLRYIRITDIDECGNLKPDKKSPNHYEEKYLLNTGDILFARSGATVGKTFLYSKEKYGPALFAGYLIRLIPNLSLVNPVFVYHFTNTKFYKEFIAKVQNTVAQPNINAKQYSELDFILPPLALQNEFADFVAQVDKSQFACGIVIKLWRNSLKSSII